MLTAERLRTSSRHDYLLYLWYVEDVLRAYGCDAERIAESYLPRLQATPEQAQSVQRWYTDLCEMMHSEGCIEGGHLQLVQNVEQELEELHQRLLREPHRFPEYTALFHKALPAVRDLQSRRTDASATDLHTILTALYGLMLLVIQGKEVSSATRQESDVFGALLQRLSAYYTQEKQGLLDT